MVQMIPSPATIGDVYRGYRGNVSLVDFVNKNFDIGMTEASGPFVSEYSLASPGKTLLSVQFMKKSRDGLHTILEKGQEAYDKNKNPEAFEKIFLNELLITEFLFGPMAVDYITDEGFVNPSQEFQSQIYEKLNSLQERNFALPVVVVSGHQKSGWPAMDINMETAFYHAAELFGGINLIDYMTEDGTSMRFDGELKDKLNKIRNLYPQSDPYILPTQLIFLTPENLWRIYQEPPLPEYAINLKDRFVLYDYIIEAFRRMQEHHSKG